MDYQAKIVCDPLVKTKGESYRLQDAKARNRRLAKSVTNTVDGLPASS